mmetsp:Transcript_68445/g.108639  ORF Transcript_68445/g.108639 Transcript_68445/m.108639 type:complete len:201 (+) Transcript_68445:195-797(+)
MIESVSNIHDVFVRPPAVHTHHDGHAFCVCCTFNDAIVQIILEATIHCAAAWEQSDHLRNNISMHHVSRSAAAGPITICVTGPLNESKVASICICRLLNHRFVAWHAPAKAHNFCLWWNLLPRTSKRLIPAIRSHKNSVILQYQSPIVFSLVRSYQSSPVGVCNSLLSGITTSRTSLVQTLTPLGAIIALFSASFAQSRL